MKFQTFRSEELASPAVLKAAYQEGTTGREQSQLEMLKALELNHADYVALCNRCCELGLIFLSTPFDVQSADLLFDLGMPAFKVLSGGEITNLSLLIHLGIKGRSVIISFHRHISPWRKWPRR